jgi:hypothetical protein
MHQSWRFPCMLAPPAAFGELLGFHRHFYLKHDTVLLPLDISSIKEANTYFVCEIYHSYGSFSSIHITVVQLHQAPLAWPLR